MSASLPDSVATLLRSAGWHENRRVPVNDLRPALQQAGCLVSAAAESFLAEFHGLRVETAYALRHFDVHAAVRLISTEDIRQLERLVAEPLCAIACTADGTAFMTPSGRVVTCSLDWAVIHLFENYHEFLRVCSGETFNPPLYPTEAQLPEYLRESE